MTVLAIMIMMILMTMIYMMTDDCDDYGDYDGDVTADVSSMEEHTGHDVIRSDVILPQTDSDESSAVLETGVVGAVGTGSPWSQTGGLRELKRISSLIQGVRRLFKGRRWGSGCVWPTLD